MIARVLELDCKRCRGTGIVTKPFLVMCSCPAARQLAAPQRGPRVEVKRG